MNDAAQKTASPDVQVLRAPGKSERASWQVQSLVNDLWAASVFKGTVHHTAHESARGLDAQKLEENEVRPLRGDDL